MLLLLHIPAPKTNARSRPPEKLCGLQFLLSLDTTNVPHFTSKGSVFTSKSSVPEQRWHLRSNPEITCRECAFLCAVDHVLLCLSSCSGSRDPARSCAGVSQCIPRAHSEVSGECGPCGCRSGSQRLESGDHHGCGCVQDLYHCRNNVECSHSQVCLQGVAARRLMPEVSTACAA